MEEIGHPPPAPACVIDEPPPRIEGGSFLPTSQLD
jgi:hypothetical protein